MVACWWRCASLPVGLRGVERQEGALADADAIHVDVGRDQRASDVARAAELDLGAAVSDTPSTSAGAAGMLPPGPWAILMMAGGSLGRSPSSRADGLNASSSLGALCSTLSGWIGVLTWTLSWVLPALMQAIVMATQTKLVQWIGRLIAATRGSTVRAGHGGENVRSILR